MNGSVALYAMLLVAVSGIVGRFIYRHVHRGLYGRELTLRSAQAELEADVQDMDSVFALQPDIEWRLKSFHDEAFARIEGIPRRIWRFVGLSLRGRRLSREIRRDARRALTQLGEDRRIPADQLESRYRDAEDRIDSYLDLVVQAAQLASWERAFSLWHVVHIPFLYLLVISGIVHVIAVHMY